MNLDKVNLGNVVPGDILWLCKEQKWAVCHIGWGQYRKELTFILDGSVHCWLLNGDGTGFDGQQLVIPLNKDSRMANERRADENYYVESMLRKNDPAWARMEKK